MKYLAAYLLARLGGDTNVTVEKIATILDAGGLEIDRARAERLVNALRGQNLDSLIKEGVQRLAAPLAMCANAASADPADPEPPIGANTMPERPDVSLDTPASDSESEDFGNIFDADSDSDDDE